MDELQHYVDTLAKKSTLEHHEVRRLQKMMKTSKKWDSHDPQVQRECEVLATRWSDQLRDVQVEWECAFCRRLSCYSAFTSRLEVIALGQALDIGVLCPSQWRFSHDIGEAVCPACTGLRYLLKLKILLTKPTSHKSQLLNELRGIVRDWEREAHLV